MESDHIKVLIGILLIWGAVIMTWRVAARHDRRAPADDIGIMWLVVLAMYCTLPPLSWLVQGGAYSIISFQRLLKLQPTGQEVLQLMYIGIAYAVGFTVVYLFFRRTVPRPNAGAHARITGAHMAGALVFVLGFLAFTIALRVGGHLREADSYVDSYRAIQELPLGLRQVLKISSGFAAVAKMVLVAAILQRWPRSKGLFVLYLAIVVVSFDPSGSRKAMATSLLAAAMAWHILVRPVPTRWWITSGVFGFVAFTVLGILRGIGAWEDGAEEVSADDGMEGIGLGELDALWANAVNLLQERESKLDIPLVARYNEFWSFIPSQLLPFEKIALNDWYIETFFPKYKLMGGGWEFGALSQAVIGAGAPEAALRGAAVAILLVSLLKWYRSPTATWWRLPLYLYLMTVMFLSIRDTTLRPLVEFAQVGVPALLLIELIAEMVSQGNRNPSPTSPRPPVATNV